VPEGQPPDATRPESSGPRLQKAAGWGDAWTWTAIDADTKLITSYMVGTRTARTAYAFMRDLASRVTSQPQLTTDALYFYPEAIDAAFGSDVDYGQIVKRFGRVSTDASAAMRYSPASITSVTREVITGSPDEHHISTSYVERQNLSMRMGMRRFTRLTNGFSKKLKNHVAANALYFLHYNFARIHKTLRITPAMAAGFADHIWSLDEIVGLLDAVEGETRAA
jgi:IS1 family transposase